MLQAGQIPPRARLAGVPPQPPQHQQSNGSIGRPAAAAPTATPAAGYPSGCSSGRLMPQPSASLQQQQPGLVAAALGATPFLVPASGQAQLIQQNLAAQAAAAPPAPLPEPTAEAVAARQQANQPGSTFESFVSFDPGSPGGLSGQALSDPAARRAWVDGLCRNAFAFVDAQHTEKINATSCKTAIIDVFQKILRSDPDVFDIPSNAWFIQAFKNFDEDGDGLLSLRQFQEIVIQYYEHKLEKKSRAAKATASTAPSTATRTTMSQPSATSQPSVAASQKPQSTSTTSEASPGSYAGMQPTLRKQSSSSRPSAAANVKVTDSLLYPQHIGKMKVFEDYEFLGSAGSGSFGQVLIVRHMKTGAVRACKRIPVETPLERELVETEINLLRQLNHPNIMRFFESYGEGCGQNGNVYLMVELCKGGDLFSRILHHYQHIKKPMTEAQVGFYIAQILSALHYCHTRSPSAIIHRDLKPENVLFLDQTAKSPLKVIDFGLANSRNRLDASAKEVKQPKTGFVGLVARALPIIGSKPLIEPHTKRKQMQRAGTAPYMAPEMIEGEYDERVDIFSAGVILYQLLTGKNPFYEPGTDDEKRVREKISSPVPAEFPPDVWADVTKDAQDLTRKMLEKNPRKRLSAAEALSHHWVQDPSKPSPFGNRSGLSVSIFEGLQRYQNQNKLKRAVLQLLAKDLSEFEIQDLRKKFLALDTKGDGMLSAKELAQGMQDLGYTMSSSELDAIMATLDTTGADPRQRCISYNEFIAALMDRRIRIDRQQLLELFNRLGGEDKGRISLEDAQRALRGRTTSQVGITASEFFDLTGSSDGTIDFEQFCELILAGDSEPPPGVGPSRGSSGSTAGGTPGSRQPS
eukprot:CAMPEP_0178438870 /NCGR_PEP_ID=MMETSP0689_2-20121128/35832_1 /TAXON_ID=160604 /ORGANISM="Amphidinium massartii, Strain CS-259" /LENGTH=862 /DNA_ID=CAMNT_0020061319 /DNA_START=94 /DNA_END=2678 /DNA_ORIENTATION=-